MPVVPSDYQCGFKCFRFAVKLCFAIIINKTHGHSLRELGVDLREECFLLGQLYVACS
jgi:hypothetical protein